MKLLKVSSISLFVFLSLILASPVLAVEKTVPNEVVKGLDMGIFNTKIVSQEGNKFKISFDVVNNDQPQAGLKYTVKLIEDTKEGQFLVDSYISKDVFSVGNKSTVSKEIDYTAPSISGKYKLFVFLSNVSGYNLGLNFAGDVTIVSSLSNLEITPSSCFLTIAGEKVSTNQVKYNLTQGVDISKTENLNLSCEIINPTKQSVTATPSYETHLRNMSGEIVTAEGGDATPVTLKAGEKKTITLSLPKVTKPQAYDVSVLLKDGSITSNSIVAHYVVQGASATILRASLDKDYYSNGDTANILVSWAPSADSFADSRIGKGTDDTNLTLASTITNSNGGVCLKETESNLTSISISHKANIPVTIKSNCKNPKLLVQIKDASGTVLDQKEFTFESTNLPESKGLNVKTIIFIVLGIIILVGIVAFIIKLKKKKK